MLGYSIQEFRATAESRRVFLVGEEFYAGRFKERRFSRKMAGRFVFGGEFARFDLARFDVGLIESVDANDGAGPGGGNFPAEALLAEGVDMRKRDANDRMARFLKRGDCGVLRFGGFRSKAQIGEDAIVAVAC